MKTLIIKGGPGSGHFGHAGRPGKRGGSAPGTGAGVAGYLRFEAPIDIEVAADFFERGGLDLSAKLPDDVIWWQQDPSINEWLRTGVLEEWSPPEEEMLKSRKTIDAYVASMVIPENAILLRGAEGDTPLARQFGTLTGADIIDEGFAATTLREAIAAHYAGYRSSWEGFGEGETGEGVLLELLTPKGFSAGFMPPGRGVFDPRGEFEILLPRDTIFHVVDERERTIPSAGSYPGYLERRIIAEVLRGP